MLIFLCLSFVLLVITFKIIHSEILTQMRRHLQDILSGLNDNFTILPTFLLLEMRSSLPEIATGEERPL